MGQHRDNANELAMQLFDAPTVEQVNLIEDLLDDVYAEGHYEGYDEGYDEGYFAGVCSNE